MSPDPDELRAWCATSLTRFQLPARVHLIDQMPMTAGTNGSKIRAVAKIAYLAGIAGVTGQRPGDISAR